MNEAVQILLLLTRLAEAAMKAANEVSDVIDKAQEEGRDLTPEELALIKIRGDSAVSHWNNESIDVKPGG